MKTLKDCGNSGRDLCFESPGPIYKARHHHECMPATTVLGSGDKRIVWSYWPVGLVKKKKKRVSSKFNKNAFLNKDQQRRAFDGVL